MDYIENQFVDHILESFKNAITNAFYEEPDRFKYSLYIINMINSLNLSIDSLLPVTYDKVAYEFANFLRKTA